MVALNRESSAKPRKNAQALVSFVPRTSLSRLHEIEPVLRERGEDEKREKDDERGGERSYILRKEKSGEESRKKEKMQRAMLSIQQRPCLRKDQRSHNPATK
jgi:hypothetical protein